MDFKKRKDVIKTHRVKYFSGESGQRLTSCINEWFDDIFRYLNNDEFEVTDIQVTDIHALKEGSDFVEKHISRYCEIEKIEYLTRETRASTGGFVAFVYYIIYEAEEKITPCTNNYIWRGI